MLRRLHRRRCKRGCRCFRRRTDERGRRRKGEGSGDSIDQPSVVCALSSARISLLCRLSSVVCFMAEKPEDFLGITPAVSEEKLRKAEAYVEAEEGVVNR